MPDIVDLILAEHARIGRLFAGLYSAEKEQDAGARLSTVWADLAGLLETHVAATREICYLTLLGDGDNRRLTADLDDIAEAVAEARLQPTGSRLWWLAVRAARAAAIGYIDDVESGPVPQMRRLVPQERRLILGSQWQAFAADRAGDAGP